jgi:hypothetical protein
VLCSCQLESSLFKSAPCPHPSKSYTSAEWVRGFPAGIRTPIQDELDVFSMILGVVADGLKYKGKSLNNRNFILKCMEKYAQQKILFWDIKWLLSNMPYGGRDDRAV